MKLHDHLAYWARIQPDRICVADGQRTWTYSNVDELARRCANALGTLDVRDGDRVGILAKNCLEWLPLYYGMFRAGVVPVPLNYRLHPKEWVYILNDAGARAIVAQSDYAAEVDSIRADLQMTRDFVAIGEDRAGWCSWDAALGEAGSPSIAHEIKPDHEAFQMYTSGTTGRPKGAVLSHDAVVANIAQLSAAIPPRPAERLLVVMPLYHSGAALSLFAQIATGGNLTVMAEFHPARCVRALDEDDIAIANFVPAMIQAMLVSVPDVRDRSYPNLRVMTYGASPIAESTLRDAMEVFHCDFYQAYGMTEICLATVLGPNDHRRALAGKPGLLLSAGRPMLATEVRIVDDNDNEVSRGSTGEVLVRGPQLMKGYWNLPDDTTAALRGGWMHTGDAGYLDEDDFLYVSDRVKDMVVSGGENIYPREIENVIFLMPEVADVAVIGVPDETWGEAVKAIIVVAPNSTLAEADVNAWCRGRLAGFKCPKSVDFLDVLPRNPSGKVQKTTLRERYWSGKTRMVS